MKLAGYGISYTRGVDFSLWCRGPDVRALDQSTVFDAFSAFLTVVTRVNSVLDIPWVN